MAGKNSQLQNVSINTIIMNNAEQLLGESGGKPKHI